MLAHNRQDKAEFTLLQPAEVAMGKRQWKHVHINLSLNDWLSDLIITVHIPKERHDHCLQSHVTSDLQQTRRPSHKLNMHSKWWHLSDSATSSLIIKKQHCYVCLPQWDQLTQQQTQLGPVGPNLLASRCICMADDMSTPSDSMIIHR